MNIPLEAEKLIKWRLKTNFGGQIQRAERNAVNA